MQVYSVTVMTHVKALQPGQSSQGTSEPITPALYVSDASGPYNHVVCLSIWYTTTPGSAIAVRVPDGSWPCVCPCPI